MKNDVDYHTERLHSAVGSECGGSAFYLWALSSRDMSPFCWSASMLRSPQRILFTITVSVLTYRSLHGTAPSYLSSYLPHVDKDVGRPPLIATVSKGAFPDLGANRWNEFSSDITSAPSLSVVSLAESQDFPVPSLIYFTRTQTPS